MQHDDAHSPAHDATVVTDSEEVRALYAQIKDLEQANMELARLVQESEAASQRYAGQLSAINVQLQADILGRERIERELRQTQQRYHRITREVTDYVYTVRVKSGRPVETRHGIGCEAVTGYQPEEFQQDPLLWLKMIPHDDKALVTEKAEQILSGEEIAPFEHRIVRKDGAVRWIRSTPVPCYDLDGKLRYYDGLIKDVTEQRLAEDALEHSESRYRELVENALSLILRLDKTGRITFCNEFAQRYLGYSADDLMDMQFFGDVVSGEEDAEAANRTLLTTPERYRLFESLVQTVDGFDVWVSWRIKPLRDTENALTGLLVVGLDVTERKKLEEQLRQLSRCDGLTGIPNRRVFDETMDREFHRAFRSRQPLSLILLDIDHFKGFNDSCGHQAGDDCLKRVAAVLEGICRRPTDLAARYGGEEFAVVLPDTDEEGAIAVAEELREEILQLRVPHPQSPVAPYVTISLGVSTTRLGESKSDQELLAQADHALYNAKRSGRNQVRHIAEELDTPEGD